MFRLDGQIVLITGGATGIGRAMAEVFCEAGAKLAIASRRMAEGEEIVRLIQQIGGEAIHIGADITLESDVKRVVQATLAHYNQIDVLVNNAGIMRRGAVTELTEEDWDEVLETDLKGVFLCAKHVLPPMLDRQYGAIVNIAAIHGLKGGAGTTAAYTAAKGGLVSLSKSMAVRYGPQGVRVNCICPGFVPTDMNRHLIEDAPDPAERRREYEAGYPLRRLGTPHDVAYAALFLASSEASWITGATLVVDGGLIAK
ncbi:MAG TPA: 3-oxoacyl-ACP reductase family protein [Acidobacteriota bacterium]|nr:3-oxoacyl-ACP reductase family protein [Acidobacteriota bacterium]HNB73125.1 3-oxoacyl-ACP reductase family protein [Acidobacteriota bacterium]HNG93422.1 3-oxoacyl-ACP reductase family protein [Acidobacteriota bacterium]